MTDLAGFTIENLKKVNSPNCVPIQQIIIISLILKLH